jgi:hypothetical protein
VLFPEALVVGSGHTALYASLTPSDSGQPGAGRPRRLPAPGMLFARLVPRRRAKAAVATMTALVGSLDEVTVVDDRERGTPFVAREWRARAGDQESLPSQCPCALGSIRFQGGGSGGSSCAARAGRPPGSSPRRVRPCGWARSLR